ncbi:hypothetical protein FJZ53_04165 [Candidatus Woesearchaeota archaeon]|nr:hypothetical protein [Candidatus Woesearchaeota archaeon]
MSLFFKKKKIDVSAKKEVPKELPSLARDIIKRREEERLKQEAIRREAQPQPVIAQPVQEQPLLPRPVVELKQEPSKQQPKRNDDLTYFSTVLKNVLSETQGIEKAEKFYKEGMLSQDLLTGMKQYWVEQKKNILFDSKEEDLREKLLAKIAYLQDHEKSWQTHHLSLIDEEERIRLGELELKQMLKEFRELCRRHIFDKPKEESPSIEVKAEVKIEPPKIEEKIEARPEQKITDYSNLNISPKNYFQLADGRTLKDLRELLWALESMSDSTFISHVNSEKNDFANWIKGVMKDEFLAARINEAIDKSSMIKALTDLGIR